MSAVLKSITVRQMRKSVRKWLQEEKATIAEALALQSAIEGGLIDGSNYDGPRWDTGIQEFHTKQALAEVLVYKSENDVEDGPEDENCGCLLYTFERIRDGKRLATNTLSENMSKAFALALMLRIGDTPENSPWARAAVKGIQDYVAEREANG